MVTLKRTKLGAKVIAIKDNVLFEHELIAVTSHCKYFNNAQHKLLQLKPIERAYLDFLCERMTLRNKIHLGPKLRKDFIKFCKEITSGKTTCSEKTLSRAEKHLHELHLLINVKDARLAVVNPKHFFKGSQALRKAEYNELAELANKGKIPLEAILDRPVSSLEPNGKMLNRLNNAFEGYPAGYIPGVVSEDEV